MIYFHHYRTSESPCQFIQPILTTNDKLDTLRWTLQLSIWVELILYCYFFFSETCNASNRIKPVFSHTDEENRGKLPWRDLIMKLYQHSKLYSCQDSYCLKTRMCKVGTGMAKMAQAGRFLTQPNPNGAGLFMPRAGMGSKAKARVRSWFRFV